MTWAPLFLVQTSGDGDPALAPLLAEHCVECHGGELPEADLDLAALLAGLESGAPASPAPLERVRSVLLAGEMPPRREPRPPSERVERALAWLERELGPAVERPELRRLNRVEFERAVRDLVDVAYPARELFPADDVGARFDNDAAGAAASELLVERWIDAAERIAEEALPADDGCATRAWAAGELELEGSVTLRDTHAAIYGSGGVAATVDVSRASRYRLELTGWADLAGDALPRLRFTVDGADVGVGELAVEDPARQTLVVPLALARGTHRIDARFVNDHYAPDAADPGERDRNVHVERVALVGPLDPPAQTGFTRWLDAELARGTLDDALAALGLRAWRRPLAPEELARLASLSPADAPPRARMRAALVALLASPSFLYKVERDAPTPAERQFELATRLAFFLWASGPDDELLARAARGELDRPAVLAGEVRRLLRDARSRALVEEFGAQWLGWRALARATPDRRLFPEADPALLSSMRQECEAFFEALLREDRPLTEFLDAPFAFVDERLARLYGIEGITGEGVRRVPVAAGARGGLLGQAALLTVTSNPTRTSPVKRGKWVLETLLGERVAPPPPGVGTLPEPAGAEVQASLVARLERHRAEPECASCHAALDPLGFALEGFDALGRARTHDREVPVEARGELPDGTVVEGFAGLQRYLIESGRFPRALARALFAYALGREPNAADDRELSAALAELAPERRTLAGVIEVVAISSAFRGEARR